MSPDLALQFCPGDGSLEIEHIYDYEPGGHHPVRLGDTFGDAGRYRVIHKLGSGGFATVWLCQDMTVTETPGYWALKIVVAARRRI
ncbi:hypothetical protein SAPIO_CDS9292 [Scedosporium apiospermum]|uniref:non-specific serine/threonine protein kinase n=1 Tax=Pseudallescheria apiosperma TaxID=563466 RepID=A0A084FYR9_PSEDA|nr:uncharacterized protein SAPIO_CDS9292 [Scedosporium apiospermum]KEZ40231.1 hypothetical protein SAPIO_CDS9292 [Scedosporium apiospermum]